MNNRIHSIIADSIQVKQQILQDKDLQKLIEDVVAVTVKALAGGNRLWFCGNGGSAADAQHLAAEFTGRFYKDRRAVPAEAFHCNTSYLTAVANDYGFGEVYARMVDGVCEKGDILFGFSTSGNSENIYKAFEIATVKGVTTVGFTGSTGGKLKGLCQYLCNVPSTDTPRIQEAHIMIGHIICELAEQEFFQKP